MALEAGKTFAVYGALLDFDNDQVASQLDNALYINATRDTISITELKILLPAATADDEDAIFKMQVVTADFKFYELSCSLAVAECDTISGYSQTSTTFIYFKSGSTLCAGNSTSFVTPTFSISGTGAINANGSAYANGLCFDSVRASATVTDPVPLNRSWVVTQAPGVSATTTQVNGATVSGSANVVTLLNSTSVTPYSTAYTDALSADDFTLVSYYWNTQINHSMLQYPFILATIGNPQCVSIVGVATLTCGE